MKYILILVIFITTLTAKTTMCYKNGWDDPSNIEQQIFKGGECKGSHSIDDMKNLGWKVEDIKLSTKNDNMNYIYIMKQTSSTMPLAVKKVDYKQVIAITKEEKEKKRLAEQLIHGKKFYINKCESCHGKKGEDDSTSSRALNNLSLDELQRTIRGYQDGDYDRGTAIIMNIYASFSMKSDIEAVYIYLKNINKQ